MKNKKRAGFKMKKSVAKMFGLAAAAGQRMMNPNAASLRSAKSQMMGSLNPEMQAYNEQMRAYKRNEFLGQQKGKARKGYRKMKMPVKPSSIPIGRPNPYPSLTPEQIREMSINVRPNPYATEGALEPMKAPRGLFGGGPRRFSGGVSQLGNMQAQLAPFMMKKGSKPNKSEFFKGKK